MRLPWSFPRPAVPWAAVWLLVLLLLPAWVANATGDEAQDVARSLGVTDAQDWDIRSLYRVRFQHITPRTPKAQRMAERKSKLATRWAALKERIAEFFPSRHTNPRTVVTFDRLATDFVNVGIVKLAKVLDPPKTPTRRARKSKTGVTVDPPAPGAEHDSHVLDVTEPTKPTTDDGRPKRRVTLLVDLPEFFSDDGDDPQANEQVSSDSVTVPTRPKPKRAPPAHQFLPSSQLRLVDEAPCGLSSATGHLPRVLLMFAAVVLLYSSTV